MATGMCPRDRRLTHGVEAVVLEAVAVAVRAPAGGFNVAGDVLHDFDHGVDRKDGGRGECEDGRESSEGGGELHDEDRVEFYGIGLGC